MNKLLVHGFLNKGGEITIDLTRVIQKLLRYYDAKPNQFEVLVKPEPTEIPIYSTYYPIEYSQP